MKAIPLIGRILFSFIFLKTITSHFSSGAINHAASMQVPMANILVPASGIMAILGAVSIILGYRAKLGAWLIVLFLIPVTLFMHQFWNNPEQQASFLKNMSMLGGALMIAYFGSGPLSLDRNKK